MRINPYLFGFLVLVLFLGSIGLAQANGLWSISGKVTSTGEKVAPSGTDVTEIKGWMTLGDITNAYQVPLEEIITTFGLPADTTADIQLKSLESDQFSVTGLRDWLATRQPTP